MEPKALKAIKATQGLLENLVPKAHKASKVKLDRKGQRVIKVTQDQPVLMAYLASKAQKANLVYILAQKTQETSMMFGLIQMAKL